MEERKKESLSMDRLLVVAERLFSERGFSSVTLRDISQELRLSHASLYYHFPGGKEELFIAVTKRSILRHGEALARVLDETAEDIRSRLHRAADWFLSQPPLDLIRMSQSDMPVLKPKVAREMMDLMYSEILVKLQSALQKADKEGSIRCPNPGLVGGALVGMIESFHSMPDFALRSPRTEMAREMIDILLKGLGYTPNPASGSGEGLYVYE